MRFVPAYCIREGMKLGQSLYGPNGEMLLARGTDLKDSYIDKIQSMGFNGAYIDDDISRDIETHEMISAELKSKTVIALKRMFIRFENERNRQRPDPIDIEEMSGLIDSIYGEISSQKNLMANMVDIKIFDDYTYYHSANVTVLSLILGMAIDLDKSNLLQLGMAALLHDIGKVFVPKEILNKPGALTDEEFREIKTHTAKGYEYLKDNLSISAKSYVGVLQHHEKYDGEGYPHGRSKGDISLFGRIIAIADVYDALTSDRPYRKGLLPSEAMEYIMANGGRQFDHELVKIFSRKVAPYPIGSYVYLSDGKEGLVVENYEDYCMRPRIKVVRDMSKDVEEHYHMDLLNDLDTYSVTISGIERAEGTFYL